MRSSRHVSIVATAIGIFLAGASVPAFADNIYPTGNTGWSCSDVEIANPIYCQTDNRDLTMYRESSLTAGDKARIGEVMAGEYSPTDLTLIWDSSPSYEGSAETDIVYQQGSIPHPGFNGMAWCDDAVSSTKCDQHKVRFRYDNSSIVKAVACHESGHAVGLTHGHEASPRMTQNATSLKCMGTASTSSDLGSLNTSQINGVY